MASLQSDCLLPHPTGQWVSHVSVDHAPFDPASTVEISFFSLLTLLVVGARITREKREAAMAMATTMRPAAFFAPSVSFSPKPQPFFSARRVHHRLRALPATELTLEELNPSVDLLRKTAEAVGDFRKTPIYIVGTDCNAKRNIAKLLANSIIYRYLCSEDLLEDVLGGKDALNAFRDSDEKGYLEVETEGLKQLTSMGSLVLVCGDGAVMNSTNLGLLRHGVSIWIDVPLELAANDMLKGMGAQAISDPDSFSQAMGKLRQRYDNLKERYAVSDVTVSLQNVASQLGYGNIDSLSLEDMVLEIVKRIEKLIKAKAMMEAAGKPE